MIQTMEFFHAKFIEPFLDCLNQFQMCTITLLHLKEFLLSTVCPNMNGITRYTLIQGFGSGFSNLGWTRIRSEYQGLKSTHICTFLAVSIAQSYHTELKYQL